ncbi:MAG: cob(I)yrinic acid a,c-diamide adenosyltransferase [Bacteroidetes bacterium]|nr:cob(I)yrinic acid a,c-diamide adenosyltransferase [Bacteroidota bacterium]
MDNKNNDGGSKYRDKVRETIENYSKLSPEEKNCLHIYYGYGKGKTTSTIGLAIRAIGAGKSVAIVQFDKGYDGSNEHYSERNVIRKLKDSGYNIDLFPTGCERMNPDGTFRFKNEENDFVEAKRGLDIARKLITEGNQDLLILDESIAAAAYNLISKEDVEELISLFRKNRRFEMVMTGHKIWKEIEEAADLITEMRKVKHYFDKGIPAREGIEF